MKIQLTNCEVEIKDSLTWGDVEEVQIALISGAKVSETGIKDFDFASTLEAKYKLLEISVIKITTGEVETKFTRDWMKNLSVEDGNKLYLGVDSMSKKK